MLGSPPALKVAGVGVLLAATVGALVEKRPTSLAFAALAVVVAWRLFGLSGSFEGRTLDLRVGPVLAILALGVVGTGLPRAMHMTMIGRVDPNRGAIAWYPIPVGD